MWKVSTVVTYSVFNDKNYTTAAAELTDELLANKMAAALNVQEDKFNAQLAAQGSKNE